MNLEKSLDAVHRRVVSDSRLQIFTAFTRLLLGIGFIPPSIPKILHQPFTILPDSNPVGHYFNALYQTGFYYQFIGWAQLTAAVLILIPRTAHIGALLFLPIILNITVLTNAVGFKGTWLITILMSMASLYLVCWEYDRWKPVLFGKRGGMPSLIGSEYVILPLLFAAGAAAMASLLAYAEVGGPGASWRVIPVAALIGAGFGICVYLEHRWMRLGSERVG